MRSLISEDDLVDLFLSAWDTSIAAAPGNITKTQDMNLSNTLLVRRMASPSKWVGANVLYIDNQFEFRLSHPDKNAIDALSATILAMMQGLYVSSSSTPALQDFTTFGTIGIGGDVITATSAKIYSGEQLDQLLPSTPAFAVEVLVTAPIYPPTGSAWEFEMSVESTGTVKVPVYIAASAGNIVCYDGGNQPTLVALNPDPSHQYDIRVIVNNTTLQYAIWIDNIYYGTRNFSSTAPGASAVYYLLLTLNHATYYCTWVNCKFTAGMQFPQMAFSPELASTYRGIDTNQNYVWNVRMSAVTIE